MLAQTPQGFPFWPIMPRMRRPIVLERLDFTDDAAIAEWAKMPVKIVAGSPDNVKLTWARDIAMADQRLSGSAAAFPDVRTGNGYDVHAFEPGDHVVLCGVAIPHGKKLSGHSDADVALHALTDALLATCGAGDIGTHFPPSDPQWRGAASRIFVEHAARLVRDTGGRIANADITLICRSAARRPAPRGDGRSACRQCWRLRPTASRSRRRPTKSSASSAARKASRRSRRRASSIPEACPNERSTPFRSLARAVLDACRAQRIMLATAESCTGGMIAAALTDIAGSSDVVDRGFVTYSNEAKMEMLGVSPSDARCAWRGVARDRA